MHKEKFVRYPLACLPTPLLYLEKTTRLLGTEKFFIKRDDLTGRILGGNKLRKLEYIISDAKKQKADTIVTTGSFESNHVCLTAAVARIVGMNASMVLMGQEGEDSHTFNEKVERKLGIDIHQIYFNDENRSSLGERVSDHVDKIIAELKSKGANPYFIPGGGCCLQGSYSFTEAFNELNSQMEDLGHESYDVVLAVGTGSTYAGLCCGSKLYNDDVSIHGISIARKNSRCTEETFKAVKALGEYLGINCSASDINIDDAYVGDGYGSKTDASRKGVDWGLKEEGILFDHTYAGKAFGAFLDLVKKGTIGKKPVVFWHTGGVAGAIDTEFSEKEIS